MTRWDLQNRDQPFLIGDAVTLDPGEQVVVTLEPEEHESVFFLRELAATKATNTTYTVEADGTNLYGPAPLPPTDVDDSLQTFVPPENFSREVVLTITNGDPSKTVRYAYQANGWERRPYPDEGGW